MKKVFLDNLPLKSINNRLVIDWEHCQNYIVNFIYDEYEGKLKILNYNKNNNHIFF